MKTKKSLLIIIAIIILTIFCLSNKTIDINTYNANIVHSNTNEIDFPIYSEGAVLMESSTGKILYGKNENEKLYPASTTKILTAIIAIEHYDMTDKVTANSSAITAIPAGYSNAAIQPDETLTVQELLELFLIHSANEAGYILAEDMSGSIENFATIMNKKVSEIGCKNTHFTNPSGIHDENHYSTPYDMALITKYCMQNEIFRKIVSQTSCTINATDKYEERYFKNTNDLLDSNSKYYYKYAIGIKTGYTSQAKNCLISASKKDNMELITVTLGAEATSDGRSGRYVDTINLFDYGFANYKIQEITPEKNIFQNLSIKNATKETKNVSLISKTSINALVSADTDLSNLNYDISLNDNITAPISENDILGKVTYDIDGISYSSDLIADHNVEEFTIPLSIVQACCALVFLIFILIIIKIFSVKKKKNNKNYKNYNYIYKLK